jgi:hypothetical protein
MKSLSHRTDSKPAANIALAICMRQLCGIILSLVILSCHSNDNGKQYFANKLSDLISADSLKFILLTKQFPHEGWDFAKIDDIPIYSDTTFSSWTDDKRKFSKLISSFPKITDTLNPLSLKVPGSFRGDYNAIYFFFDNSIFAIKEQYDKRYISTPKGYFMLADTINFYAIKQLLDRKAYHKQSLDKNLTHSDSIEINLRYNKYLTEHIDNGVGDKDTIWKTSWYLLK